MLIVTVIIGFYTSNGIIDNYKVRSGPRTKHQDPVRGGIGLKTA